MQEKRAQLRPSVSYLRDTCKFQTKKVSVDVGKDQRLPRTEDELAQFIDKPTLVVVHVLHSTKLWN